VRPRRRSFTADAAGNYKTGVIKPTIEMQYRIVWEPVPATFGNTTGMVHIFG
jgi:hypothetical protein